MGCEVGVREQGVAVPSLLCRTPTHTSRLLLGCRLYLCGSASRSAPEGFAFLVERTLPQVPDDTHSQNCGCSRAEAEQKVKKLGLTAEPGVSACGGASKITVGGHTMPRVISTCHCTTELTQVTD